MAGMDTSTAATVEKAVDVLFHLNDSAQPQGVTAVGRALGLPKSSVHRLLTALGRRGLVERDERGHYRPGVGLVALGLGVLDREPVVAAGRAVLEQEARSLGETIFLVGLRAQRLVVLDKAEGTGFLRASPQVGAEVPVHATAAGKLYCAHEPDLLAAARESLRREPEAFTSATMTSREAFDAAIEEAAQAGHALNRDEWIAGLSVVAAPVVASGRMLAAVALAASSPRFDELGVDELARRVREAGARIGARLEGRSR